MASYPTSIPALPVFTSTNSLQPSDMNAAYREIESLCAAVGINPTAIDDTVTPGAAPSDIAAYLDMVANVLKTQAGVSHWYDAAVPLRNALFFHGGGNTPPAGASGWIGNGQVVAIASLNQVQAIIPFSGQIRFKRLHVQTLSACPSGADQVVGFYIYVDGTSDGMFLQPSTPAGIYHFIVPKNILTLAVGAADYIGVECFVQGGATGPQIGGVCLEYEQVG